MKITIKTMHSIATIILGNLLLSLAMSFCYINYKGIAIYGIDKDTGQAMYTTFNGILAGGTSGFSLILRNLINIIFKVSLDNQVEIIVTVITWVLFFIGLIFLGKKFALQTLLSTILSPIFIFLFKLSWFDGLHNQMNQFDPVVCAIIGGLLSGTGCGIIYRIGGSTGGFDIPGIIINKYSRIKLSTIFIVMDGLLVILAFVAKFSLYEIVIGLITVLAYSLAVELTQRIGTESYFCDIISEKWEEINKEIIVKLERGTTIVDVVGGYTDIPRKMIKTMVGKKQYLDVVDIVKRIDPNAFMSMALTRDVFGEGYRNIKEFSNK